MYKKKICFLTGKRGGYDAMKPLLDLIVKDPKIELKIIVTDQHLMKMFGNTYKKIENDFKKINIFKIPTNQKNSKISDRMNGMSNLLKKTSFFFSKYKPDLLMIYGDRAESLISSFVAVNFKIPIAHFQGGDLSGNIDEIFRHSITKLSNYHFVSNKKSYHRINQMGENSNYIYDHGDNHLDPIKSIKKIDVKKIFKNLKINQTSNKYCMFLLHPETYSKFDNKKIAKNIFSVLLELNLHIICVYPCTDQGYQDITTEIENIKKKYPEKISVFKNIQHKYFINLLSNAQFLIGNSSCGIIECPFLNVWSINVGERQQNRIKSKSVINSSFSLKQLKKAVLMTGKKVPKNKFIYGNGDAYLKNYKQLKNILKNENNLKLFYEKKN